MYRSPDVYDNDFMVALRYPPKVCDKFVKQTRDRKGGRGKDDEEEEMMESEEYESE